MAYLDFNGKKVYYEIYGEGKPLVLLNGIMMSTASWHVFREALSAYNKLILIDFLDQGKSDKMENIAYTQDIQVEVLRALLDELNLAKANIAGISYGGEVAMQFSVKYEAYVDKLVLFNTTAKTTPWLKDIGVAWNRSIGDPMDYYCTTIPVIYSPNFYNEKNQWINNRKDFLTEKIFSQKAFMDSMVRLTESADNHDVTTELSKLKVPTLIVGCENDYITPMAEQKLIKELISTSELVILPNTGHGSMYERPTLFVTLLLGFINMVQDKFNIT